MNNVYFTSISSTGGNGPWSSTTGYPVAVGTQSCVASTQGIYCIGGSTTRESTSSVYFAPFLLKAPGLGEWTNVTSLSRARQAAVLRRSGRRRVLRRRIPEFERILRPDHLFGAGSWTATASYPLPTAANLLSCANTNVAVYCVGGQSGSLFSNELYGALVSFSGLGPWSAGSDYPFEVIGESCVVYSGTLYCVGGEAGSGYYHRRCLVHGRLRSVVAPDLKPFYERAAIRRMGDDHKTVLLSILSTILAAIVIFLATVAVSGGVSITSSKRTSSRL